MKSEIVKKMLRFGKMNLIKVGHRLVLTDFLLVELRYLLQKTFPVTASGSSGWADEVTLS